MAKKKLKLGFKIVNDSVVATSFALICAVLFVLDSFVFKNVELTKLFLGAPTARGGELPFVVSEPLSYVRILMYVFGANNLQMFTTVIYICMFGPIMEDRYGSVIIGIMMFVSGIFSGVLNACFCQHIMVGPGSIVFMMLFLNAFLSISKKKIPLSFVVVFVFYILVDAFLIQNSNGAVGVLIEIAGGLCGSLFAFLASPKARAEKKNEKKGTDPSKSEREAYLEELDSQSPRFKKNNNRRNDEDDGTTVVGTLKF